MRRLAADSELKDDGFKVYLCASSLAIQSYSQQFQSDVAKNAAERLAITEREIERLQNRRSGALLHANAKEAEIINREMKALKDQAVYSVWPRTRRPNLSCN